ncbi:MAG: site-specific DNA-methyltransferase [Rikenellaceae bacterium]
MNNRIERSSRNKTITLTDEDVVRYVDRTITLERDVTVEEVLGRTINQDLFEVIDHLPKGFVDLLVIDPPYNLSKNFNGSRFSQLSDENYEEYVASWLPRVVELLKPNGSLYICCDWKSTSAIYRVLSSLMSVKNRITWQREKGRGAKTNWKNGLEDIWFAVKSDKDYYFDVDAVKQKRKVIAPYKVDGKPKDWEESENGNFRLTHPSNFWDDISIPYWSMPENTDHPTQKPEKLIAKLILASSPIGGVVFDPFLGSGTTSVVAKKLGRRYCGIEINREYASWAEYRLERANEDCRIQGYSDGVFWERNSLAEQNRVEKSGRKGGSRVKRVQNNELTLL